MKTVVKIAKILTVLVWILFILIIQIPKYIWVLLSPSTVICFPLFGFGYVVDELPQQWMRGECEWFITLGAWIFALIVGGFGSFLVWLAITIFMFLPELVSEPIMKWVDEEDWDEEKK